MVSAADAARSSTGDDTVSRPPGASRSRQADRVPQKPEPPFVSASLAVGEVSPGPVGERVLRRALGPTAWAVLDDLWADARPDAAGVMVVPTNARQVAANVGIGKDTAARALRRLCASGLVRRRSQGVDPVGRFSGGEYELCISTTVGYPPRPDHPDTVQPGPQNTDTDGDPSSGLVGSAVGAARHSSSQRRRGTPSGARGEQLCLLDPTELSGKEASL